MQQVKRAGMRASVIAILGLGGTELSAEHAEETGRVVRAMDPEYLSMLTLMLVPGSELHRQWQSGAFELPEPADLLHELRQVVARLDGLSRCVFRTNHASNYLPLAGTLSRDKARLLAEIDEALTRGRSALRPRHGGPCSCPCLAISSVFRDVSEYYPLMTRLCRHDPVRSTAFTCGRSAPFPCMKPITGIDTCLANGKICNTVRAKKGSADDFVRLRDAKWLTEQLAILRSRGLE